MFYFDYCIFLVKLVHFRGRKLVKHKNTKDKTKNKFLCSGMTPNHLVLALGMHMCECVEVCMPGAQWLTLFLLTPSLEFLPYRNLSILPCRTGEELEKPRTTLDPHCFGRTSGREGWPALQRPLLERSCEFPSLAQLNTTWKSRPLSCGKWSLGSQWWVEQRQELVLLWHSLKCQPRLPRGGLDMRTWQGLQVAPGRAIALERGKG